MNEKIARQILENNKKNYNFLAEDFSKTRVYPWEEMKELSSYIKEGQKILDLGCGNGRSFELLKEKKVEYHGLDFSEKLIGIAAEKYQNESLKPEFKVGDVLKLPYEKESFDLIFAIAVFHHLPSFDFRLQGLEEMKRVLKKDGLVLMTNWNLWQGKYLWRTLKSSIASILENKLDFGDVYVPWITPRAVVRRYYHSFTLGELERIVKKAGFEILENRLAGKKEERSYLRSWSLVTVLEK